VRKMEDPQINEAVRTALAQEWAPEQIAGRMQQQDSDRRVCSQSIYTWIKQDEDRAHWESMLRRRGKRPYRRKNAATTGDAARIDQRPEVIEERLRLGDFEGDTVLSTRGHRRLGDARRSQVAVDARREDSIQKRRPCA